jgi:hypothetical protein
LKSVFKSVILFSLLTSVLPVSGLELKLFVPMPHTELTYEIAPLDEDEEAHPYPAAYLGYERQVVSGNFNGSGDFSGVLTFGYTCDILSFLLRVDDDDILEGDSFTLIISLEGYADKQISWNSTGQIEKKTTAGMNVELKQKTPRGRIYHITLPWESWPLLQHKAYEMQLWVQDKDHWGEKTLVLQDRPARLLLNPFVSSENFVLAADRFYLCPEETLTLYGEWASEKDLQQTVTLRVNGHIISETFTFHEGRTPFELVLGPDDWREDNVVEWMTPSGGKSIFFEVSHAGGDYIPVRSKRDNEKNEFLHRFSARFEGPLFRTPYEFFFLPGRDAPARLIVADSYEKAYEILKAGEYACPGDLYVYVFRDKARPLFAHDFYSFWEEKSIGLLFIEGKAGRPFIDLIKKNPPVFRPAVHLIHFDNPGALIYDPEIDTLRSYTVTLWKKSTEKGFSLPDFFCIKTLPDNGILQTLFMSYEESCERSDFLFLRSYSLGNNRLGPLDVYELLHYNLNSFSVSLKANKLYAENIRYFTLAMDTDVTELYLNGRAYHVFPGRLNRFVWDDHKDVWSVFVGEGLAFPSVKDFFSAPVTALDQETVERMRKAVGVSPPLGEGNHLLYWGRELPIEAVKDFDITVKDGHVLSMNGNPVSLQEPFLMVFQKNGKMLLWMTASPSGFYSYPSNYIVLNDNGLIRRFGEVLPR